jgi:hypothetical protein
MPRIEKRKQETKQNKTGQDTSRKTRSSRQTTQRNTIQHKKIHGTCFFGFDQRWSLISSSPRCFQRPMEQRVCPRGKNLVTPISVPLELRRLSLSKLLFMWKMPLKVYCTGQDETKGYKGHDDDDTKQEIEIHDVCNFNVGPLSFFL